MARYYHPSPEQQDLWKQWLAELAENVRKVAERFDPWALYRLKSSGHRVSIQSFSGGDEGPVTLTVAVTGDFNVVAFDRAVFGIDPDDLEECDLPAPNEVVGSVMTHEQVEQNIDALRVMVRPDLWEMGSDGKARRRDN